MNSTNGNVSLRGIGNTPNGPLNTSPPLSFWRSREPHRITGARERTCPGADLEKGPPLSLSDCPCGGTIALGPTASNRCDRCGKGVFEPMPEHWERPAGWTGDDQTAHITVGEVAALRARVAELESDLMGFIESGVGNSLDPVAHAVAYSHARKSLNV